jgi:hypothetical protein
LTDKKDLEDKQLRIDIRDLNDRRLHKTEMTKFVGSVGLSQDLYTNPFAVNFGQSHYADSFEGNFHTNPYSVTINNNE